MKMILRAVCNIGFLLLMGSVVQATSLPSKEKSDFIEQNQKVLFSNRGKSVSAPETVRGLLIDVNHPWPKIAAPLAIKYVRLKNVGVWDAQWTDILLTLTNAEYLEIDGDVLTLGPHFERLHVLTKLRYLRVSLGRVQTFFGLEKFTQLEGLDLSENSLKELPPAIGALTKLKELSLAFNNLGAWRSDLSALHTLAVIDLSHNQISRIEPTAKLPVELASIDLSSNKLEKFPALFLSTPALDEIVLSYNYFGSIPDEWLVSSSVKKLTLSDHVKVSSEILSRRGSLIIIRYGESDSL